jgi:cysteine desulfurase
VPVYLDHAATTPVRPEVIELYAQELARIGNPSSVHTFGQSGRQVVEEAREEIARAVVANRSEVIFTSGGTEADNLAIKGLFWQRRKQEAGRNVIISALTEHHAVIDTIEWLELNQGAQAVWVPVGRDGLVDKAWLSNYLAENHEKVALITLMWVNNETGVITDIPGITKIAKPYQIPVHSDAVAALGHIPITFAASGLAAMSITGHKVGSPVGVGALIVSRDTKIESLQHGGGQERAIRAGTMNAAGALAFARASTMSVRELVPMLNEWSVMKRAIIDFLNKHPELKGSVTGSLESRSPNNVHVVFEGCAGDSLLYVMDSAGVAVSNGSACTAGVTSASHVLLAMGYDEEHASGGVRITFGYNSRLSDVEAFLEVLPRAVESARKAGFTHAG